MPLNSSLPGPKFIQLFGPVIDALKELGGSARPPEVRDQVAETFGVTDEERSEMLEGGSSRYDNIVAWARFYLAKAGYIDSSKRGVWTLTEKGREAQFSSHEKVMELCQTIDSEFAKARAEKGTQDSTEDEDVPPTEVVSGGIDHRQALLSTLQELPPDGFERFCQRLLRESGFQDVKVTGRSGDGGIDGIGILR
jgi:restriction system protein